MLAIQIFVLLQGYFLPSFSQLMQLKCSEQGLSFTKNGNYFETEDLDRHLAIEKLESKIQHLRELVLHLTSESDYQRQFEKELYSKAIQSFEAQKVRTPSNLDELDYSNPSFSSIDATSPQMSYHDPAPTSAESSLVNPAQSQTQANKTSSIKTSPSQDLNQPEQGVINEGPKTSAGVYWVSKWYHPTNEEHSVIQTLRYCDKLYLEGRRQDGVYDIIANGRVIEAFCELQKGGHNWVVFQRRQDGSVDFYKNWTKYVEGFGLRSGEFWIGLSNLHELTRSGTFALRVDLEDFDGNTAYAEYSSFSVEGPSHNYRLRVSGFSGNAGDSLSYHNGFPFSTYDRDNDNHYRGRNCAQDDHGAWWYNSCQHSNLNGKYLDKGVKDARGVGWYHWKHNHYSMKTASMKLRAK